ncbi:hypothetical protein PGT21_011508 [Puccinia graminis f. sp. tritici]|uniref:Uncharacterized protein n=1 Tax=Puccinia graminis f. sp. tritici TaxID=56615 RepID=A0A5B0R0Z3_PUCGR|nr:hypothetical protein PGT21_011508 [Puccinia graminis f. sp. tritici]
MAFFRFRNVEAVLLLLLISSSQVASFAVERRDQSDTEIKPYCEQPKIQGNPGLMAHDCAVAFYNFKYEGEHKVVRSNDGSVTSTFGTCRQSTFLLSECCQTADATVDSQSSSRRAPTM